MQAYVIEPCIRINLKIAEPNIRIHTYSTICVHTCIPKKKLHVHSEVPYVNQIRVINLFCICEAMSLKMHIYYTFSQKHTRTHMECGRTLSQTHTHRAALSLSLSLTHTHTHAHRPPQSLCLSEYTSKALDLYFIPLHIFDTRRINSNNLTSHSEAWQNSELVETRFYANYPFLKRVLR